MVKQSELGGDFVRLLASILDESKLSEIEYETDGVRIRVAREKIVVSNPIPQTVHVSPSLPESQDHVSAPVMINNENAIKSPIVGTAYRSAAPGDPYFVEVGSQVKEGDILLIIEAMKVMNPLKSTRSGVVKKILVEDASPVEYGEILMIIE